MDYLAPGREHLIAVHFQSDIFLFSVIQASTTHFQLVLHK